MTGLIIDNFAGGGGASTGIEAALGSPVTANNVRGLIESQDMDVIDAIARGHSRKPDAQYDYCRRLCPAALRFVELFARQRHPGWDAWGNEIDKFTPEPAA